MNTLSHLLNILSCLLNTLAQLYMALLYIIMFLRSKVSSCTSMHGHECVRTSHENNYGSPFRSIILEVNWVPTIILDIYWLVSDETVCLRCMQLNMSTHSIWVRNYRQLAVVTAYSLFLEVIWASRSIFLKPTRIGITLVAFSTFHVFSPIFISAGKDHS